MTTFGILLRIRNKRPAGCLGGDYFFYVRLTNQKEEAGRESKITLFKQPAIRNMPGLFNCGTYP
jgi:hypothetical protein